MGSSGFPWTLGTPESSECGSARQAGWDGGARSLLFSVLACVFPLNSRSRPDLSVITEHHQADSKGNYQHSRAAIRWAWRGDSEH